MDCMWSALSVGMHYCSFYVHGRPAAWLVAMTYFNKSKSLYDSINIFDITTMIEYLEFKQNEQN